MRQPSTKHLENFNTGQRLTISTCLKCGKCGQRSKSATTCKAIEIPLSSSCGESWRVSLCNNHPIHARAQLYRPHRKGKSSFEFHTRKGSKPAQIPCLWSLPRTPLCH